mmetsp:Transcript_5485/g.5652  ORF Transcript_5485/g.5652 Transcript_5485/m.5652 type:complete len:418 (+) Transcript_5485:93-1346(+)
MGSGALGKLNEGQTEGNAEQIKSVDDFILNVYRDSPEKDGLNLILSNENGRKAFLNFLNNENGEQNYNFFKEMERLQYNSPVTIAQEANEIMKQYQKPDEIGEELTDQTAAAIDEIIATNKTEVSEPNHLADASNVDNLQPSSTKVNPVTESASTTELPVASEKTDESSQMVEKSDDPTNIFESFKSSANNTMALEILKQFPKFLESEAYKKWREEVNTEATAVEVSIKDTRAVLAPRDGNDNTLAAQSLQYVNPSIVSDIFRSGSWLGSFVTAAEALPVCITLADANVERLGFPLIYVNKAFETLTGYDREKIRGTNCKFLQGNRSEQDSISRMGRALSNYEPIKICITNYRDDGTPFTNLLAMKPVFDMDGYCRFILGVQYDTSGENSTPALMKLASTLLDTLPDKIPTKSSFWF